MSGYERVRRREAAGAQEAGRRVARARRECGGSPLGGSRESTARERGGWSWPAGRRATRRRLGAGWWPGCSSSTTRGSDARRCVPSWARRRAPRHPGRRRLLAGHRGQAFRLGCVRRAVRGAAAYRGCGRLLGGATEGAARGCWRGRLRRAGVRSPAAGGAGGSDVAVQSEGAPSRRGARGARRGRGSGGLRRRRADGPARRRFAAHRLCRAESAHCRDARRGVPSRPASHASGRQSAARGAAVAARARACSRETGGGAWA